MKSSVVDERMTPSDKGLFAGSLVVNGFAIIFGIILAITAGPHISKFLAFKFGYMGGTCAGVFLAMIVGLLVKKYFEDKESKKDKKAI